MFMLCYKNGSLNCTTWLVQQHLLALGLCLPAYKSVQAIENKSGQTFEDLTYQAMQ